MHRREMLRMLAAGAALPALSTDMFAFFVNSNEELWDFVLGVNLRGTIAVTHAVLPSMQRNGRGAIEWAIHS